MGNQPSAGNEQMATSAAGAHPPPGYSGSQGGYGAAPVPAAPPGRPQEPMAGCADAPLYTSSGTVGDEEDMNRIRQMQGKSRRQGIAAESVSVDALKDYQKPVYPKSPDEKQHIRSILLGNDKMKVLIGHLDASSMDDVANAFFPMEAVFGQDIIRQGDEGDCLYICDEGNVDIYVARPGPDGYVMPGDKGGKVASFGAGSLFGELALMYSAPRAATVTVASTVARLWAMRQEDFKMLLAHNQQSSYNMYEGWLGEVSILQSLNQYELSRLSELLESQLYDAGEVIIQQGEIGDRFYILEDGECSAFIAGPQGEKLVKTYATPGDYCGERALLTDEPRAATIRATGTGCSMVSVLKDDFVAVLGPVQDLLRERVGSYQHYDQFK